MLRSVLFRIAIPALLAVGFAGCSCGEYHAGDSRKIDSTAAVPLGNYTSDKSQLQCDASGNCTLRFRDTSDTTVWWTVDFVLDSVGTQKTAFSRGD